MRKAKGFLFPKPYNLCHYDTSGHTQIGGGCAILKAPGNVRNEKVGVTINNSPWGAGRISFDKPCLSQ